MFPCLGGERYWPLTGSVGFFRAPLHKVARKFVTLSRGSPWSIREFASFEGAFNAFAPYPFYAGRTRFAVEATDPGWVVVLDTGYPGADIKGFMSDRAQLDLRCEFVAVEWMPKSTKSLAGASFVHYRPSESGLKLFSRPRNTDRRWVQTSDQDGRWQFDASGDSRPFEEFDRYEVRRKAERLPRELLGRYLAAVGIPVDQDGWLSGPVIAAIRGLSPGDDQEWSSMVELRRLCGYPEDRIPADLVRF